MPPLNIQQDTIKPQHIEMDNDSIRENFSQNQLVSSNSSTENIRQRLTKQQITAVVILTYVNLINYMDRYTVAGLLSDIKNTYNISDSQAGLLQTAFIVVYMFMAPLYGYLGDRFNRKFLMCSGVFIWSLTTLLGSFMPNYGLFLLMRCFVGIGEASYSTIAPTILSDYFVADMRSKMLAVFYFAIPVGSGLGYIVGSEVGKLAESLLPDHKDSDAWRWGLRVTPALGLIAVLLLFFVLREPPRGEVENAEHLKPSSFKSDIKHLLANRSYVLGTVAFTCVTYVAGALAWWGPIYVENGAKVQNSPNVQPDNVSLIFGVIAMLAGIIGVPLGSFLGQKLRVRYPSADPLVCASGLLISMPLIIIGLLMAGTNVAAAFSIVLFGQIAMNLNWAVVSDMILYICIPTRRSSATAFQILTSHAFGDAGSPYIVGLVAEAFKPIIAKNHNLTLSTVNPSTIATSVITSDIISSNMSTISTTPSPEEDYYLQYKSLQYSLVITTGVLVIASAFFFWTALHIRRDKERCNAIMAGNEAAVNPNQIYRSESDVEQTRHLIT